jgi:glycerol-3-phosphate acyltransferase PlsY
MQLVYLAFFYLLGSIPVAWVVCKLAGGGDIRRRGSGNAGVMNVAINVARWAAVIVMAAEAAKGALTVYLAQRWGLSEWLVGLAVVAAVAGTRWSVWLKGDGGRGNTLGVAALLVLAWPVVVISLGIFIAARLLTRSSFWATRAWLLSLPLTQGLVTQSWAYVVMGGLLAVIYLSMHQTKTDDHKIIKKTWPNLWAFITAPRRRRKQVEEVMQEPLIRADIQE